MDRIIEKKRWTTKLFIQFIVVGLFLFFIVFLLFIRGTSSKLKVDLSHITTSVVKMDKFQEFIPVDGIVHPKRTIFIDAIQGGTVEKIYVEDGAILKKGDTILKLSNASVELDYMNRESQTFDVINNLQNSKLGIQRSEFTREDEIADLKYQLDKAKIDFKRKNELYDEKVISIEEFEIAKRDFDYLKEKLEIAKKMQMLDSLSRTKQIGQINSSIERMDNNLEMLKEILGNLYIKAPVSGKLSSFIAEIGETKSKGQNLGQIDVLDGFKLKSEIDERYITRVFVGQEAEIDFMGKTYDLEISKIYTQVTNGAFQVDFAFSDETPEAIKRGQTIQVRLKFSGSTNALIIKKGGFFQETGGNWIYVLDSLGEMATKRRIKIGRQNTEYYEVIKGLKKNEKVIVSTYKNYGKKDVLVFK
ncbi:MAG: HlyD family efflux transporter periplasmic adaptor subunit [Saprospiraceae bacterium]|nr:HlyD family efflux transporter periplasmic adaptor subunit [Saprospiraceae bacterium]